MIHDPEAHVPKHEDDEITIGSFKTKSPHRNPNLYVAIGSAVALWNETGNVYAAIAVVIAFLIQEGYVRGKAVEAAGHFASSIQIEHAINGSDGGQMGELIQFEPDFDPNGDE